MPTMRSSATSISVIANTGVASTRMTLVEYSDQTKIGSRYQPSPGARIRWMVTMKLSPVRIDENPATTTPVSASTTWPWANSEDSGV